jgi:hypothetical protein
METGKIITQKQYLEMVNEKEQQLYFPIKESKKRKSKGLKKVI